MANFVVYADVRAGAVTAPTVAALAEARRIADALGATVFALVAVGPTPPTTLDGLAAALGAAGADRVLGCTSAALAGAPLDPTHGPVLLAASQRLRPTLVLFPAGGSGEALGPSLALRLGAIWQPHATLQVADPDDAGERRLLVARRRPALDGLEVLDVRDLERPVVLTVAAAAVSTPLGDPLSELELMADPAGGVAAVTELEWQPDPDAALEVAEAVVLVDADPDDAALSALARAAGVPVASTRRASSALEVSCPGRVFLAGDADRPPCGLAPATRLAAATSKAWPAADLLFKGGKPPSAAELAKAFERVRDR